MGSLGTLVASGFLNGHSCRVLGSVRGSFRVQESRRLGFRVQGGL